MNYLRLSFFIFSTLSLGLYSCELEELEPPPSSYPTQEDDNNIDDDEDDNQEDTLVYTSPCTSELEENILSADPNIFYVDTLNTYLASNSGLSPVTIWIEADWPAGGEIKFVFDGPFEPGVYETTQTFPEEGEVIIRIGTSLCSVCPYLSGNDHQLYISAVDDHYVFEFCDVVTVGNDGSLLTLSGRVIIE